MPSDKMIMLSDQMIMDSAGIPSVGSNKYKSFMRILNQNKDFYSFVTKKIEDYKTQIEKCKNTCLNLICEKENDRDKCAEIKRLSKNAETEEELENNIRNGINSPTKYLSQKCIKYADNKNLEEIENECFSIETKEINIINLMYVWLNETYKKYEEGDHAEKLITEYNEIYNLTKALPILFNSLDSNVIFKNFKPIEPKTISDNTDIVSSDDITSTNEISNLHCKKIDNSDPFTLKCQWKTGTGTGTGTGGNRRSKRNHRTKGNRKRYTKRRAKKRKRESRRRKR
jgi:hypothetical protein